MKKSALRLAKSSIAGMLAVLLAGPLAQAAPVLPSQNQEAQNQPQTQQTPAANPQNSVPDAPSPQLADPATRPSNLQSDQQQNSNPVGTAAAPVAKPTGVAASRPAGAVIAPAKQRRVRPIVIRVGIIVGAAVAVGTVVGLSRASSSRP